MNATIITQLCLSFSFFSSFFFLDFLCFCFCFFLFVFFFFLRGGWTLLSTALTAEIVFFKFFFVSFFLHCRYHFLRHRFQLRTRNSIRGFVRPSVGWSVGRSVGRSVMVIELKTSIFDTFCVCLSVGGGFGCGQGLDAPAHPSATIL